MMKQKALWAKQLYDCLDRLSDETGTVNYIISNVSAGKMCTWAPYGIDTDGIEMEGDSYLKPSSNREFQGYPLTDNDVLLSNADVSGIFAGDGAALFDIYNRYVQANYLNVPDGLPSFSRAGHTGREWGFIGIPVGCSDTEYFMGNLHLSKR